MSLRPALTARPHRRLVVLSSLLLMQPHLAPAEPATCDAVTVQQLPARQTRPAACIEVHLAHGSVLLDKALVDAHARGLLHSHPGDAHRSHWTTRGAQDLLMHTAPRFEPQSCARVDGREGGGDWQFYVALQLDRGWANVEPAGSTTPVSSVEVRERHTSCASGLGVTGTRVYRLPDGRPLLALVTSVS